VYAGKLTGISLALRHANWLKGQGQLVQKVTVLSDSQAAIQAVARPGRLSGQYILQDIYIRAKALQEAGAELRVQWVPAHVRIAGNKEADRVAKLAASQRGQNRGVGVALLTLIQLASAAKHYIRARIIAR
jgi:ribonuclease HI